MGDQTDGFCQIAAAMKLFKLRFLFYKLVEIRVLVEHRKRGLSLFLPFRVAPGKPRQKSRLSYHHRAHRARQSAYTTSHADIVIRSSSSLKKRRERHVFP
jgi:hypothetical protein